MSTPLDTAMAAQHLWKPGPTLRAAVELVKAGLRELDKGVSYFGCDSVPPEYEYEGSGICGAATRDLLHANIIKPSQHKVEGMRRAGQRKSLRAQANGRVIELYELTSRGLAEAFVCKHDPSWKTVQLDWVDMQRKGELK